MRVPSSPDFKRRMEPPATLSDAEAKVWRALVQSVASDHFQSCDAPLLAEYCRAAVCCDEAAKALQEGAVVGGKASAWVSVQEKAQRALVALSARLRVCPQSRFDRLKAGTSARTGIPDRNNGELLRPTTGLASFRKAHS
jgi:phage terminase small subunit